MTKNQSFWSRFLIRFVSSAIIIGSEHGWILYLRLITGVNSTARVFSVEDTMTDDSYFNISEMKLSITSLCIISDAPKYDIIWTENGDVVDISISEILRYELSVIESLTGKA